jgi:cell division protein FtsB
VRFFGSIQRKYLLSLTVFVSGMLLFALFGSRGLIQVYKLKDDQNRIQLSNTQLREDNRRLTEQIEQLRHNKEEVEKVAREELGLVKKGEIVYQFEK